LVAPLGQRQAAVDHWQFQHRRSATNDRPDNADTLDCDCKVGERAYAHGGRMVVLRQPLTKTVRGWLDLNGPLLAPLLYLFEYVRSYIEELKEGFDARFRTDTAAPTFGQLKPGAYFYVPTTASVIYEILNSLPLRPNAFAFVDMGSGKGRALLVASEFPFARIVGIELSPRLHQIAEENIRRYRPASQQCRVFSLHCMDVADYDFGQEPLVLFLFDPFGRETLQRVIGNLEASLRTRPRDVSVVYVHPQFEDVLGSSGFLRKVREGGPPWRPWSRYVVYTASSAERRDLGRN
jgi:Histone methylation protein DOT1